MSWMYISYCIGCTKEQQQINSFKLFLLDHIPFWGLQAIILLSFDCFFLNKSSRLIEKEPLFLKEAMLWSFFLNILAVSNQGFQVFFGHFEALQILMIMSLVFAAGGFILLFLYHRREKAFDAVKTNIGILCAICWGIAGK